MGGEADRGERGTGVEIVGHRAKLATERGVVVASVDPCSPLPYADEHFDVVISNQVIEHLPDTDVFLRRSGGSAILSVCTEAKRGSRAATCVS